MSVLSAAPVAHITLVECLLPALNVSIVNMHGGNNVNNWLDRFVYDSGNLLLSEGGIVMRVRNLSTGKFEEPVFSNR